MLFQCRYALSSIRLWWAFAVKKFNSLKAKNGKKEKCEMSLRSGFWLHLSHQFFSVVPGVAAFRYGITHRHRTIDRGSETWMAVAVSMAKGCRVVWEEWFFASWNSEPPPNRTEPNGTSVGRECPFGCRFFVCHCFWKCRNIHIFMCDDRLVAF